jgi:hypothetical protein
MKSYLNDMSRSPRLNLAAANKHVPEIERPIRMVKERIHAVRHSLPFERIPKVMTIHMVLHVVEILNYFPTKGGISQQWSPHMIMAGKPLDYKKELAMQFGSYCQVHMHNSPQNSMKERTLGGICLGPSGNEQGGCCFLHLSTGVKITAYKWTILPMPDNVILRVNQLGKDQPKDLTFYDRHG